jgi:hypothetical protein
MTMTEHLSALKAQVSSSLPEKTLEIIHRGTEELRNSGIMDRALKVGDNAPSFTLSNATGQEVRSADLLARGPMVLSFYRGNW